MNTPFQLPNAKTVLFSISVIKRAIDLPAIIIANKISFIRNAKYIDGLSNCELYCYGTADKKVVLITICESSSILLVQKVSQRVAKRIYTIDKQTKIAWENLTEHPTIQLMINKKLVSMPSNI